jgi:predicted Zn-dependent protease
MTEIDNLLKMIESGQDNPLIRFAMGSTFIKYKKYEQAIEHFSSAVEQDPGYSAAWKLYGKALVELNRLDEAKDVFEKGILAATEKGDIQAIKEMQVFLKRIKTN